MNLFQLISLPILIIFIFIEIINLREKSFLRAIYALRWVAIAVFAFTMIAIPSVSQQLANLFGIERGTDFVVYSVLIWVFYKLRSQTKEIGDVNNQLVKLVNKLALEDAPKNENQRPATPTTP